jgi:hypothetical protein
MDINGEPREFHSSGYENNARAVIDD